MTRRGTLAYYLAAWVIGGFIIAVPFSFVGGSMAPATLLVNYFFALIAGAIGLILFAFLLRFATGLLKTHNLWIWMALGAGISSVLIFLGAVIFQKQPAAWDSSLPETISTMIFRGAEAIKQSGLWQAPVDGAATAAVLCLVDRAFAKVHETHEVKQSAAQPL